MLDRAFLLARQLTAAGDTLQSRALRSGIWLVVGAGLAQGLGLIKTAVLGRLLSPADFGVLGIALLVVAWLENSTQTGLTVALVQKPGDISPYLNTVFSVQLIRGFVLALTLVAGAPAVSSFFESPESTGIVRGISVVVLLRGLTNPALVYLRREVDMRREVSLRVCAALAGLTAGVAVALHRATPWALVASLVAAQLTATLLSYVARPYRPQFRLDGRQLRDLAGFGKWIFLANLLLFLSSYLDSFFVGKLLDAAALGLYQVAAQFSLRPISEIGTHVYGVMFPSFSAATDLGQRRRAFVRSLGVVATAGIPFALFLSFFPDIVVAVTVGPKWVAMVPLLPLLALGGVAVALRAIPYAALHGIGRPDLSVKMSVAEVALLAVALYILVPAQGMIGGATAVAVVMALSLVAHMITAARMLTISPAAVLRAFLPASVAATPLLVYGLLTPCGSLRCRLLLGGIATLASATIAVAELWKQTRQRRGEPVR